MSDQKFVVKIVSDVDGKLTIEFDGDKRLIYYRDPDSTIYARASQLHIERTHHAPMLNQGFGKRGDVGPLQPLVTKLVGSVKLMDQSIEVIGDPESVTETLRICFTPVDEQARIQAQQLAKDNDKPLRNSNVEIGFSRTDWEIGNVDDWYIECIIPKETFSMLTSIVTAGRLGELVLGFRMTHIYAEYDWPSTLRKWFLGPQSDASIDFPEQARGDVAFLRITEPEVILDYKAGPDKEATRSGVDDAGAPVPNLAASALDTLARNVAALHRTLTLVGVLTVACLAILALR